MRPVNDSLRNAHAEERPEEERLTLATTGSHGDLGAGIAHVRAEAWRDAYGCREIALRFRSSAKAGLESF